MEFKTKFLRQFHAELPAEIVSVKLEPQIQELRIDPADLVNAAGPYDVATIIYDKCRPLAVSAYRHYLHAVLCGLSSSQMIPVEDINSFENLVAEAATRRAEAAESRLRDLDLQLRDANTRLDELRRILPPINLSAPEPDEDGFYERVPVDRPTPRNSRYHDKLMNTDIVYRATVDAIKHHLGSDVSANDEAGKEMILHMGEGLRQAASTLTEEPYSPSAEELDIDESLFKFHLIEANKLGRTQARNGESRSDCPFKKGTASRSAWIRGFDEEASR